MPHIGTHIIEYYNKVTITSPLCMCYVITFYGRDTCYAHLFNSDTSVWCRIRVRQVGPATLQERVQNYIRNWQQVVNENVQPCL